VQIGGRSFSFDLSSGTLYPYSPALLARSKGTQL
jgi:hypothetical protein